MKLRSALVALAAVFLLVLSASAASAASVDMTDNLTYEPSTVTIPVGDSVTWTNVGTAPHTVTADDGSFDSSPGCPGNINACIGAGESYTHTFSSAGTFGYTCTVHGAAMSGTVVVQGAGGEPTEGGALPDTGPGGSTQMVLAIGAALLVGGAFLALAVRRRRA